jgi:hypothetical protein
MLLTERLVSRQNGTCSTTEEWFAKIKQIKQCLHKLSVLVQNYEKEMEKPTVQCFLGGSVSKSQSMLLVMDSFDGCRCFFRLVMSISS